jgi:hypothetical protein
MMNKLSWFNKTLLIYLLLISSVSFSSENQKEELSLVGSSSLSVWFWDVYDITLKAPNGKYIPNQFPLHMELTYKREIASKELVSETVKQWRRFDIEESKKKSWAELLNKFWPDVKAKDKISFYVDQKKITHFYFNGRFIGEIKQPGFADAFLSIWLAKDGPYPKMTKELLGQKKN